MGKTVLEFWKFSNVKNVMAAVLSFNVFTRLSSLLTLFLRPKTRSSVFLESSHLVYLLLMLNESASLLGIF